MSNDDLSLNQVTVSVADVARAVDFYCLLGLLPIVRSAHYVRFIVPGNEATFSVHLATESTQAAAPSTTVVYFESADLDARVARLQAHNVVFTQPPTDQPWDWREARLRDPDGNTVCLYHAGKARVNPDWRLEQSKGGSPGLRDYWDLQLRFAEAVSRHTGRPLGEAVAVYTNFHRRFGLGVVHGVPASPEWSRYVEPLVELASHEERLSWTEAFSRQAADETFPPGERRFGCFACDPPDAAGTLRLHFSNRDADGASPLHAGKLARRQAELRDLFSYVRDAFPAALTVRGGSWLYHLEAYRRLFPPDYVASRRPPERLLGFQGYSSWGQFLDHRGRVRPGPRSRFLANLPNLDANRLGEAFPLPALQASAPVQSFYGYFGITPPDSARS